MNRLLIHNLSEIATPIGTGSLAGTQQKRVERIPEGQVLVENGRIADVGNESEMAGRHDDLGSVQRFDARRGTLIPGLVDPHTHLPWAGSREEEFSQRLKGKTYMEIAAAGGGILSTVRATRDADLENLTGAVLRRMDQMLAHGTTTAEAKSGYGLSLADEIKQLRAIRNASSLRAARNASLCIASAKAASLMIN